DLEVVRPGEKRPGRQLDRGDQFAVLQDRLAGGILAVSDVEVLDRNHPRALGSLDNEDRVEGSQRDAHVGGMRGDALVAGPEHRVAAVEAFESGTPRTRLALVARPNGVAEVGAAGSLQEVTADGR